MINSNLWKALEKLGTEDSTTKAYLINLNDNSQRWEFMYLPNSITIEGTNTYREAYPMFGSKGYIRYESSQLQRVSISDLIFTVPRHNRSMIPIEKDLDLLRYPKTKTIDAPKLSFVYGRRSIQPLLLESYSIEETEHLNGVPTYLVVSLSLIAQDTLKL